MGLIETADFRLDTYATGEPDSRRLALVLPGLVDTKDRPYLREHTDFLGGLGYLAVAFDPPGTWSSSGSIEDYTVTNYLQAISQLIEHYGNRPTTLAGASLGGRIALLAAMRNGHVDRAVAITTVFPFIRDENRQSRTVKWQAQEERLFKIEDPNVPDRYREFRLPYSHSEDAQQYDVPGTAALAELAIPKLFIVATRDSLVPPAVAYETYEMAAEPKELFKLNADHDYWRTPNHIRRVNRIIGGFLLRAEAHETRAT